MPKLWNETIEAHRREVREAILDTTAGLVAEHGLLAVTMSQIAEETGIGRATLYKYFAGVEDILLAWHERQVSHHLGQLIEIRERAEDAGSRLEAVLEALAHSQRERGQHRHQQPHGGELAAILHRDEQIAPAEKQLRDLIRDLLAEAAEAGQVRDDVAPGELADYCLHAVSAASSVPSQPAVQRLVSVILAGLWASDAGQGV
ncbi:MAG: TetR/AcrR family transcriptional regulator [Nitriliruptorales bacterium]